MKRRLEFCETILEKINADTDFVKHIVFSDKSSFSLSGEVNTQNCCYKSDSNPHVMRQGHRKWPKKINVWAGIFGDNVIGPIFFYGNRADGKYLVMLQNVIQSLVVREIEDNDYLTELDEKNIIFQQDSAQLITQFYQTVLGS